MGARVRFTAGFTSLAGFTVEQGRSAITDAQYLQERARPITFEIRETCNGARHNVVLIDIRRQVDGGVRWSVTCQGNVLTKDGYWEYEPKPSDRTDEFIAATRFNSPIEALRAWEARKE